MAHIDEAPPRKQTSAPPQGREKKLPGRDRFTVITMVAIPLFLVLARSYREARVAARRARVSATPLPAILTIGQAIAEQSWVHPREVSEVGEVL